MYVILQTQSWVAIKNDYKFASNVRCVVESYQLNWKLQWPIDVSNEQKIDRFRVFYMY